METEKIEVWKTTLVGQALLFGLLGKTLYADPKQDWLDTLIREEVFTEIPFGIGQVEVERGLAILRSWAKKYPGGITAEEYEAIKADHLYLFTGVGRPLAPVWESIYFSQARLLFQAQTLQVREWYARFGLQIEKFRQEPDDHIGLELSFMAHLATLALRALEAGDEGNFDQAINAQRSFLLEHLLRWSSAWTGLVKQHAKTDFYQGLALLTLGALLASADNLEIKMPEEVTL
jgi:TorA maturation chaperone TorD